MELTSNAYKNVMEAKEKNIKTKKTFLDLNKDKIGKGT